MHWTTPVLGSAATDADARAAVAELATALEAFRAGGGRLVWTVHNVLPHEAVHVDSEIAVARLLADHADLVHVSSEATLEATAPLVSPRPRPRGLHPALELRRRLPRPGDPCPSAPPARSPAG